MEMLPIKVVLLGNSGVGKTNIISRFTDHEFKEDFLSTLGVEFTTKKVCVKLYNK